MASPSFARHEIFGNDLADIHMHKSKLRLNKPVYTGMTILENSKILMYGFFYDYLKINYRPKCELIYTDTDSFLLDIQTEDVYKDMAEDIDLYDTKKLSQRPAAVRERRPRLQNLVPLEGPRRHFHLCLLLSPPTQSRHHLAHC